MREISVCQAEKAKAVAKTADKAYWHPSTRLLTRLLLRALNIPHTIPEPSRSTAARPKAYSVEGYQTSTPTRTKNATASKAASGASSNGTASPAATTNTPSPTSEASSSPHRPQPPHPHLADTP